MAGKSCVEAIFDRPISAFIDVSHKPENSGMAGLFELGKVLGQRLDFLVVHEVHDPFHGCCLAVVAGAALDVLHLLLGISCILPGELGEGR